VKQNAGADNFSEVGGFLILSRSRTFEMMSPGHPGPMQSCSPTSRNRGRLCFGPSIDAREHQTFGAMTVKSAQECGFDIEMESASLLSLTKRMREIYSSPLPRLVLFVASVRWRKMSLNYLKLFQSQSHDFAFSPTRFPR
jgi:hypothetical protein